MRFLGIGESNDLGSLYAALAAGGHDVRVCVTDEASQPTFRGAAERVAEWQSHLEWIRAAAEDGVLLFESASSGSLQDELRGAGFQVIGGSGYGQRLELDREFGQAELRAVGLQTARSVSFERFDEGIEHLRREPRRCVYKLNGSGFASTRNYVGQLADGSDTLAVLGQQRDTWRFDERPSFVLMDFIEGVEIGVGAYFNGEHFLTPACLDFEHKRFFPGDLGELTGEMGTLATYDGTEKFFAQTLLKMESRLRAARHCGYVNLNTLVNAEGVWPLEFTCRFGYLGYAILEPLQQEGWDGLFRKMLSGGRHHDVRQGYSLGVVLTVPTFPYALGYDAVGRGLPVCFRRPLSSEELHRLHLAEVEARGGGWVTSGQVGYLMVPTGVGTSVETARDSAYALAEQVVVPNLRYREDIGLKFLRRDRRLLAQWGFEFP